MSASTEMSPCRIFRFITGEAYVVPFGSRQLMTSSARRDYHSEVTWRRTDWLEDVKSPSLRDASTPSSINASTTDDEVAIPEKLLSGPVSCNITNKLIFSNHWWQRQSARHCCAVWWEAVERWIMIAHGVGPTFLTEACWSQAARQG